MKTSKKYTLLGGIVVFTTALLSWNSSNNSTNKLNTYLWSYLYNKNEQGFTEAEITAYAADDDRDFFRESKGKYAAAEDVLVQKIPGNKTHLLMMAYYSKENYSGKFVTLYNGENLVFRDDGKGYDKVAGDGFYTTRISANVSEFRNLAIRSNQKIKERKASGEQPVNFIDRIMATNPDEPESFDVQKFDNNEAVSVASVINDAIVIPPISKIKSNSMVITDLRVVEDPARTWNSCAQTGNINGPWTFKTIMRHLASTNPSNLATDAQLSNFVKNWLNNWLTTQVINGDRVEARTLMNNRILTPWLNKSRNAGAPAGQLDMRFAPFKLIAIINRFDLREGQAGGIPNSPAGEGRFVFCLINAGCSVALNMTVILEYGINIPNTCAARQEWAHQWVNLGNLNIGSSEYNAALTEITNKFSLCGSNPNKPNQSSLDQIRTNENTLSPPPLRWELKEFVLDGTTHLLKQNTVGQTPAERYNVQIDNPAVRRLIAYIKSDAVAIKNETNVVPAIFQDSPFLGGRERILGPPVGNPRPGQPDIAPSPYHWDGTDDGNRQTAVISDATRHKFSFNTCSGCHAGETQTAFTHVDPVFYGTQATLSGFLTGKAGINGAIDFDGDPDNGQMSVRDPALRPSGNPALRTFNDIARRANDLKRIAETACGSLLSIRNELMFKPVHQVH